MAGSEKYLTTMALNALWGLELESDNANKRLRRPAEWRPSEALLLSVTYEKLKRIASAGSKTAELIMQWRKQAKRRKKNVRPRQNKKISTSQPASDF